jgi:valyl-tRNA synthetase
MAKYEKMSKSRGNVVLPEEVIYGVIELDPGCEFRDKYGNTVDWQNNVWRDKGKSGFFFTATRFGRQPVFLCEKGDHCVHSVLLIDEQEKEQHLG